MAGAMLSVPAMDFVDTLTLDAPTRTRDGYLVASVRVARTGIQKYRGIEVDPQNEHGLRDKAIVNVYRSEAEVFNKDSLASYTYRPVTVDHPPEMVTADNWRDYAVGQTGGEWARDGEYVRIPMVLMDSAAINVVETTGKREISQGYTCDLDFTAGKTQDGLDYDVAQTNIRANHTAIVGLARGGHELKIGDSTMAKTLVIDGHTVQLEDAAAILVQGLQTKLTDCEIKLKDAETKVGTLTATVSTKDGEIAALTTKVKDAEVTPAKLDALVKDRAEVVTKAKGIYPELVADGKSIADIRKEAVKHKLGDAATSLDDNAILGAFAALAVGVSTTDAGTTTLADALSAVKPTPQAAKMVTDARASMLANLTNGGVDVKAA